MKRWIISLIASSALAATAPGAALDDVRPVMYATTDHPDGQFGQAVSLDGDRMVVGAPGAQLAEVLERVEGQWVRRAILRPSSRSDVRFGTSVDLRGDTIVVGSPRTSGEVQSGPFVFEFDGTDWVRTELPPPSIDEMYDVGISVVVGDGIVAASTTSPRGGVVTYEQSGGAWTEVGILTPPDQNSLYGVSMSLDGDRLAVGNTAANVVELFSRSTGTWEYEARLTNPSPDFRSYGGSLDLSDGELMVGNRSADTGREGFGVVHHYRDSQGVWELQQSVAPEEGLHFFGSSVARLGDALVVGAIRAEGSSGRAVLYRRASAQAPWEWMRPIAPEAPQSGQWFGKALAMDGDRVVISSPFYDADAPEGRPDGALYSASTTVLSLDISRVDPHEGDPLEWSSLGGRPDGVLGLFVVAVDGVEYTRRVTLGTFDSAGAWSRSSHVPPGLAGTVLTLQLLGQEPAGSIAASNLTDLYVQSE